MGRWTIIPTGQEIDVNTWVLRDNDFGGKVKLSSQSDHSFYRYSLWRANSNEHLFDGAAGDLAEAMDAMRAHIEFLSTAAPQP
jgi:hypothetical protein